MLYQQIAANKRRTFFVMFGFFLLVAVIGIAVGYWTEPNGTGMVGGLIVAALFCAIYIPSMLWQATKVVMLMNHATKVTDASEYPQLWHIVEDMAMVAQVPMPEVYIVDDPSPNAFATGRDPEHAAIAVTKGLLKVMDREELEGVIGHEMSHVKNYDIRLQSIALALTAVIMLLADVASRMWWFGGDSDSDDDDDGSPLVRLVLMVVALVLIMLAPLLATLVQLALSRNREYLADASSVELTRNPRGMIRALQALQQASPMKHVDSASAALYISDPKGARHHASWFDTHPSLDDRIARIERM